MSYRARSPQPAAPFNPCKMILVLVAIAISTIGYIFRKADALSLQSAIKLPKFTIAPMMAFGDFQIPGLRGVDDFDNSSEPMHTFAPTPTAAPACPSQRSCPACASSIGTASSVPVCPVCSKAATAVAADICSDVSTVRPLMSSMGHHVEHSLTAGVLGHADSEAVMPLLWRFYGRPTPGRVAISATSSLDTVDAATGRRGYIPGASTDRVSQPLPALTDEQKKANKGTAPLVLDIGTNVGEVTSAMLHLYTRLDCLRMKAWAAAAARPQVGDKGDNSTLKPKLVITPKQPACDGVREINAQVVSFEPSPSTCEVLRQRGEAEQWGLVGWELVCVAMVDRRLGGQEGAKVPFYSSVLGGDRQGSIGSSQAAQAGDNSAEVPAFTVDRWLREAGHDKSEVHLLKIDAEGYDAGVLDGAVETLARGAVQWVVFEYNDKWSDTNGEASVGSHPMPRPYRLGSTVTWMRELGYVCFLITPQALVPLSTSTSKKGQTPSWWQDSYEFLSWSNVLCGRREDALWAWHSPDHKRPLSALAGDSEAGPDAAWQQSPGPLQQLIQGYYNPLGDASAPVLPACAWAMM